MSSSSKLPDDALRRMLSQRFGEFEPAAPELLSTILDEVNPVGQPNKYRGMLVRTTLISLIVLLSYPLSTYRRAEVQSYSEQLIVTRTEVNKSPEVSSFSPLPEESDPVINLYPERFEGVPRERYVLQETPAVGRAITGDVYEIPVRSIRGLHSEAMSPAVTCQSGEAKVVVPTRTRPTVFGGIGLTNTQYRVTLLPQGPETIRDLELPNFWKAVSWKPQAYVGFDYKNWQVIINYKEFSQEMSYKVSNGSFEVDYHEDAAGYSLRTLGEPEAISENIRLVGLSLRRSIPLKVKNSYIGLGGGYHAVLGGQNGNGPWGQLFTGRNIRVNETLQAFVEAQFQCSFYSVAQSESRIYSKPYQIGLTAGLRWGNP